MPITIRQLIHIPNLKLRLFAGSGGVDREIRWAHASELPDPSEWLEPGALVMTTGLGLPEEPEAQRAYVERLIGAGLSGLLVGEQADERIYAPELTPCLVTAAEEHSFPVMLMPYELPFADVARIVAEANHDEEYARIGQALRIYDTVRLVIGSASGSGLIVRLGAVANCDLCVIDPGTGNPVFAGSSWSSTLSTAALDQIAERFSDRPAPGPAVVRIPCGLRPAVALAVPASRPAALVAVSRTEDQPDHFVLRHIAAVAAMEVERLKAEREERRRLGAEMLADLIDDRGDGDVSARILAERGLAEEPRVLAAFAAGEAGMYPDLHLRLEESGVPHLLSRRSGVFVALLPYVAHAVEALIGEVGSPVGLSDPVVTTARMADAHREAIWALQGARASGRMLVRYGEDAASPFLPRNLDESRVIVHQILGPVLEYDAEHGAPLMTSLRTYLSHDRSLKATSEALHVHKQTVVYRMRRVEELTGRRMGRMEDIANLWLALKALDLLGQDG
ncbi:MAG: PucR family transcriptional regulator [Actinomycetota bacterium]|nr:PucR family transcriptional regulator [Actinomycetota bacterium]